MKKIILFFLMMLLGFAYELGTILLYGGFYSILFRFHIPDELVFGLPIILGVLTICYLIWKKKGVVPIIGLLLGFFIGFIILSIGLTGA